MVRKYFLLTLLMLSITGHAKANVVNLVCEPKNISLQI